MALASARHLRLPYNPKHTPRCRDRNFSRKSSGKPNFPFLNRDRAIRNARIVRCRTSFWSASLRALSRHQRGRQNISAPSQTFPNRKKTHFAICQSDSRWCFVDQG